MQPRSVAAVSCVASALLFLFALFGSNFRVETIQPNGLPEILYPLFGFAFFAMFASVGVLLFAVTLSTLGKRSAIISRSFLGSGLFSSGVVIVLFAVFMFIFNEQDEGPRCFGGCAPSLLRYYQLIYTESTILVVLGLVATGFGVSLLLRRATVIPNLTTESCSKISQS
ncbi:MAG: hypothetical protein M1368_01785 [Thaumarchaeota archaeon]|nr:hypothetical protein [Nitrososphaerota archaeon]